MSYRRKLVLNKSGVAFVAKHISVISSLKSMHQEILCCST